MSPRTVVRAVALDGVFSFTPPPGDSRAPWPRLAALMSERVGRPVAVKDIAVPPGLFLRLRTAGKTWCACQGLPISAAEDLEVGQVMRKQDFLGGNIAYLLADDEPATVSP